MSPALATTGSPIKPTTKRQTTSGPGELYYPTGDQKEWPSIKTVERQLGNLEAFDVAFHHLDGRDVRSDFDGVPGYSFDRAAKHSMTVAAWKEQRFKKLYPVKKLYPGFECEVLDGHGHPCLGGRLLSTVRESYFD